VIGLVWLECAQKQTFNYFGNVVKIRYWSDSSWRESRSLNQVFLRSGVMNADL